MNVSFFISPLFLYYFDMIMPKPPVKRMIYAKICGVRIS